MEIVELLEKAGQKKLAVHYQNLPQEKQEILKRDILTQDFETLKNLYEIHSKSIPEENTLGELKPMPFKIAVDDLRYEYWSETGKILISQGKVAAFVVAGGQGSRLGFDGPKGVFDIGLPSHKSLFQIQAEKLLNLSASAGAKIPWCVMTSPLNHKATVEFFEENQFFGYAREDIRFFEQGTICALSPEGDALLESDEHLALVPDGNGGCFKALIQSGTLAWLVERGVEYLFLYSVDNVLCKVCDPAFIGALAADGRAQSASKVVHKRNADEKVGIFAFQNKKPTVVEYSDLPDSYRTLENADGSLVFDGGNLAIHLFKISAIRKLQASKMIYHSARKKILGIENAFKFEQFLFDAFPLIGSMLPFGVLREDEFAPVKNAEGNDSPASAREMLGKLHAEYLRKAGAKINPKKLYEISPAISYAGEALSNRIFERELGRGILEFEI